jgi:hypothetical protein
MAWKVWDWRPGALLKKRGMLIWHAFRGHLTEKEETQTFNLNRAVVIIPGDKTYQIEVCDVAVNKLFRDWYVTSHQSGCYL